MQAIFQALNFNPWTFLFQTLNLLVVMGLLYVFLYKPLGKVLADREARIEGNLNDAAAAREKAENILAEYRQQLQGARQEAQAILDRATKMAEETRAEIINRAREEAERTLAQARREIEGEKSKALAAIRSEAASLAILAAGKVLERSLTPDDQERLAREAIAEVERLQ
ncbi:F0F1 ATP synthase subunit B [Neomoorella thermoacetica]|uniref:ATP synthase subunit b n=3 Tax=Neomoorella thermoacetica TaxID=1525 RepID=ATPF_MOOTA|nr:F0F1 ATP synthase subunit B [Moorella thermoacetica]Q2RFX5.1 RecName: Full=ATP synthase subunit b; AltName: Full=ATP synthase F(0) sector subunit b; AltName: Full=ATPase subunit I; AltName: Full=F-type ATPase subunit b; Short=F-ATPase subunit b [Moorella thermoacetica ATCC 39073]AAB51462.1 ATP synthase subunit b [Moorella thermoacetica]AKX95240.1 ATP synthase subunit b [Moorella thermoacetica]AKX97865.1 ATP synthase subunit b [Moorella thermoacetica]APC09578.1 ATP synthase subunit b [Moorel